MSRDIPVHVKACIQGLLAGGALVLPATSYAQDQPRGGAAASGGIGPAEIIVTANKRAESMQKVPVSIVALQPEALADAGIRSTTELQQLVPSLSFSPSGEAKINRFYVRGVGTYALSSALESSVGVAIDGVPLARVGGSITDLVDIERVEVLKGPQGMLYGKNATAGLVGVVTRKPRIGEDQAEFNVSYGSYNEFNIDGAVNLSLGDAAALRVAAWRYGHDGYVKDIDGDQKYNNKNSYGVRASLAVEPTDALSLILIGQYDGRDEDATAFTYRSADLASGGPSAITAGAAIAKGIVPGPKNLTADPGNRPFSRGKNYYITALADFDMGGGYTLSSVTSYRDVTNSTQMDPFLSNSPLLYLQRLLDDESFSQFTQELRVSSPSENRLSFVGGLFYYDFKIKDIQTQNFFGLPSPGVSAAVRLMTTRNSLQNYAAFGELTFKITPEFRIIAGARQSHDKVTGSFTRERIGTDVLPVPPTLPVMNFKPGDIEYDATSYRFGAQFDVAPDVMIYATAARGYKAPGYNLTQSLTPATIVNDARVGAEIAKSYEIGIKSQFFDRKLTVNVTAFDSKFSNFQTTVRIPDISPPVFAIQNAGALKSSGVEFEVSGRPAAGLTLGVIGAYIDARYTDFPNAPCYPGQPTAAAPAPGVCVGGVQDLNGWPLEQSPKWSFNASAGYEAPVSSDYKIFANANYSYRSSVVYEANRDPGEVQGSYGFANVSVGFGKLDESWKLSFYARNLFDNYFVARVRRNFNNFYQATSYEALRRIGVQLSARF